MIERIWWVGGLVAVAGGIVVLIEIHSQRARAIQDQAYLASLTQQTTQWESKLATCEAKAGAWERLAKSAPLTTALVCAQHGEIWIADVRDGCGR